MDTMHTRRRPGTRGVRLLGVLVLTLVPAAILAQGAGSFVGAETCLECHEDQGAKVAHTVHGRLAGFQYPGEGRGCEACHGPGGAHVDSGDPADIGRFAPDAGGAASAPCLACHRTGHTVDWDLSAHADADVSCLACHSLHGDDARPALLVEGQPGLCQGCHLEQKAQFQMPSHHPLREGFMVCTDCHDPHGDVFAATLAGETGRDQCLTCHAQYMGPFIFEHSPVEEDCTICHNPHGAVANNLLNQNEPFLCLQCHQPHFHAGLAAIEGDYTAGPGAVEDFPAYGELAGTSHFDSFKRVMLTKCSQCHQSIHGTDLPSESIPGQGRALNR
jgi:DmsE family decaheme c-type cytochrome